MPYKIHLEDPRIGFAAAHFILEHEKCGRLHGHNYFVEVSVAGELDKDHMIIDYAILKNHLRQLTEKYDHKVMIPANAPNLKITRTKKGVQLETNNKRWLFPEEDIVLLPLKATTSELLAKFLHQKLKEKWSQYEINVTIEEAPGARASYSD
ncbi:MAG: 6-carboxytetrahydropterin synthase [Asgard group archaeon]|nr:6-carboxytetrahydropterin synthase [Asgard group archaeon]